MQGLSGVKPCILRKIMPIYAYRCAECGHAQDVLQKMSDELLTVCPQCTKPAYQKQVTAAGFQLKGSGWYVTDFRGGNEKTTGKKSSNGNDTSVKENSTAEKVSVEAAKTEAVSTTVASPSSTSSTSSSTEKAV
jgi:putative FmdB family regulatory protein